MSISFQLLVFYFLFFFHTCIIGQNCIKFMTTHYSNFIFVVIGRMADDRSSAHCSSVPSSTPSGCNSRDSTYFEATIIKIFLLYLLSKPMLKLDNLKQECLSPLLLVRTASLSEKRLPS